MIKFINEVHLIPLDDYREHEPNTECWCKPRESEYEIDHYIHNPLDNRFMYQLGILKYH